MGGSFLLTPKLSENTLVGIVLVTVFFITSQKLYVEDAVKCSLKQVEEEHRLAVAIKIASSDDEECEAKEI
jgi:hypothetical protein